MGQCTWSIGQSQLGSAIVAKPNQNVWGVSPEERANLAGKLHRFINPESL
jgi:hypothetical protein